MTALALIISDTLIHQDAEDRYCLNDLHKASGGEAKNKPSEWLRNKQTIELIEEISKAGIPALEAGIPALGIQPVATINGGNKPGTYAVKELVYAYAMWISPAFSLKVIRAYDALVTGQLQAKAPSYDYVNLQDKHTVLLEKYVEVLTLENDRLKSLGQTTTVRRWTPEEDQILLDMKDAGYSNTEIGLKLNRGRDAVRYRYAVLNAKRGGAK